MYKTPVQVDQELNINSVTPKLTKEKMENRLDHINIEDHFLNITAVVQILRLTFSKRETERLL